IVKMVTTFPPPLFFEYHKQFSSKAAAILSTSGVKIDWSVRDDKLYFSVFAGRRARNYDHCQAVDHSTDFCPAVSRLNPFTLLQHPLLQVSSAPTSTFPVRPNNRSRRHPVTLSDGRHICFNFNEERGCNRGTVYSQMS
ncbi:unnamed protein product, partial [Didymodactylos carnosus]